MTRLAIRTRYHGPTNSTGSRLSVTDGGSPFHSPRRIYVDWDYALHIDDNHKQAAQIFLTRIIAKATYPSKPVVNSSVCFNGDQYHSWKFTDSTHTK